MVYPKLRKTEWWILVKVCEGLCTPTEIIDSHRGDKMHLSARRFRDSIITNLCHLETKGYIVGDAEFKTMALTEQGKKWKKRYYYPDPNSLATNGSDQQATSR